MFIAHEVRLDLGFAAAQARLSSLVREGSLLPACRDAYEAGARCAARVGPARSLSHLVEVQLGDLRTRDGSVVLAMRWEATGRSGGLFPALDADVSLAPAGENASLLTLTGVYRPPFGHVGAILDQAVLHRVATATVRTFLSQAAGAIASRAQAVDGNGN